ncbi:MAG: ThuA domain-containing protein [Planctomycetota bacterium]|nr:ThuA domain-containing protein [Planctomycetota bacterium]
MIRATASFLIALFITAPVSAWSHADEEAPRVLFLTHSAGFVHSVVRRPAPDQLAHAERVLKEAAEGRVVVDCTQDCGDITPENLARYDAVLFYTTGSLPISDEGKEGLIEWVREGGAFCGVHCATDTFYEFADYMGLVGGAFDGHPWHEEVTMTVEDRTHPSTSHLGERWVLTDEIYQFKWWRRHPSHVLLSLDADANDVARGKRVDRDYANAWCKDFGRGKMFYTALGHREDVWTNPAFQEHLIGGIEWAVGGDSVSVPSPPGAVVLLDVEDRRPARTLAGWRHGDGGEAKWRVTIPTPPASAAHGADQPDGAAAPESEGGGHPGTRSGYMQVVSGTGNLFTRAELGGDYLLHVEFMVPPTPETNGWQDRGNSGVYVQGRYEVQVLDSLGLKLRSGDCGGIYGKHVASVDACKPAGYWQSYDIEFRSPRRSREGEKTENARMSVWHNGILIHDDVQVDGPTAAAVGGDEPGSGPLMLQDHGHPVRYRNIWALPR